MHMATQGLEGLASAGSAHNGFSIEDLPDRYRLHNVPYLGKLVVIDRSKALLDNGAAHTQKEWAVLTRDTEWKIGSGPEEFASSFALHANREHPDAKQRPLVTEVKNMLANDFRKYGMMTSTRIHYAVQGQDIVIHDFGYDNERRINQNIVGSDGCVKEGCGFDSAIGALLGTEDCGNVNAVYSWVSGKQPYLWRFNQRPGQNSERALVLGRSNERFSISAYGNFGSYRPARGMVVRGAENSPQKIS